MGRVWARFHNPKSAKVKIHDDLRTAARIWQSAFASLSPSLPIKRRPLSMLPAAADAMAAGELIGIGGWFCLSEVPVASDAFWFMEQFSMAEFPSDWGLSGDTQRYIACWETLAQQALL